MFSVGLSDFIMMSLNILISTISLKFSDQLMQLILIKLNYGYQKN